MAGTQGDSPAQIGLCIDIDEAKQAELERHRAAERCRALARLVRGYVFEARLLPTGELGGGAAAYLTATRR